MSLVYGINQLKIIVAQFRDPLGSGTKSVAYTLGKYPQYQYFNNFDIIISPSSNVSFSVTHSEHAVYSVIEILTETQTVTPHLTWLLN